MSGINPNLLLLAQAAQSGGAPGGGLASLIGGGAPSPPAGGSPALAPPRLPVGGGMTPAMPAPAPTGGALPPGASVGMGDNAGAGGQLPPLGGVGGGSAAAGPARAGPGAGPRTISPGMQMLQQRMQLGNMVKAPISAQAAKTRMAAARGRGGDSMMAHMTPGEIAVPPQVQTPEVLASLNKAFASAGANPTSYQVGHPDARVNPDTGAQEFSFFNTLLPIILPLALTAIGAPYLAAAIGPAAAGIGIGAEGAGLLASGLTSAAGGTAAGLINGQPFGRAALQGALSGAGSVAGGALFGGANPGMAAPLFGEGPAAVTQAVPAVSSGGAQAAAAPSYTTALGTPAASELTAGSRIADAFDAGGKGGAAFYSANPAYTNQVAAAAMGEPQGLIGRLFDRAGGAAGIAGSLGGGYIGSQLADAIMPPKADTSEIDKLLKDNSRPYGEPRSLASFGVNTSNTTGPIKYGATRYPTPEEILRYGHGPQFNFFPV